MSLVPELRANPHAVKELLTKNEQKFMGALDDFGQLMGFTDPQKTFTGAQLCGIASEVVLDGMYKNFGEVKKAYIEGFEVLPYDFSRMGPITDAFNRIAGGMVHFRVYFRGSDGGAYFIDPTFGQFNPLRNRVVMDRVENQKYYYQLVSSPRRATEINRYRPATKLEDYMYGKPHTVKQEEAFDALFRVF